MSIPTTNHRDWTRITLAGREFDLFSIIISGLITSIFVGGALWLLGAMVRWCFVSEGLRAVVFSILGIGLFTLVALLAYWTLHRPRVTHAATTEKMQADRRESPEDKAHTTPNPTGQENLFTDTTQESERIQNLQMQSRWWEYRYLSYYLVEGTQLVLDWLHSNGRPVSLPLYHHHFLIVTPDQKEREARLRALEAHYLIHYDQDDLIAITPKGKEYLEWRGAYPYSQATIDAVQLTSVSTIAPDVRRAPTSPPESNPMSPNKDTTT